ncbi:uncharacterized protein LOC135237864 isoform X2 [Anguilla rostrata]|uniref:uncharacterized protein LOC135237864 isoform X2 n=1 Tax=Anguilla rostrata TaxID=7938 RepID=UPI0030CBB0FD
MERDDGKSASAVKTVLPTERTEDPAEQDFALNTDGAKQPGRTISCVEQLSHIHSGDDPFLITHCTEEPAHFISCAEESAGESAGEPVATISSAKEPAVTIDHAEQPAVTISCAAPVLTTDCTEPSSLTVDHIDQEEQKKKNKKKWSLKKGKKGTKAKSVSLTVDCSEEPVLTLNCTEQVLAQNISCARQTPAQDLNCAEQPGLTVDCIEKPALAIDCAEQQRLEFPGRRKLQLEHFRQDETQSQRNTTDHTVLGFPNIGNTCYMNATLQSLFSLRIFTQDIRREEGCWRCLADLQSAQASYSKSTRSAC